MNTYLRGGRLVGISDLGMCLFDPGPHYGREFEKMNVSFWGGKTSGIVGLFPERTSAEACLAAGERGIFSERFSDATRATLEQIGDEHPVFVIGDSVRKLYPSKQPQE